MNKSRRLTVAAAVGSVALCVVAACSSGGGKTGQGALGNLNGPSTNPTAGVSGPPGGQPTVTPSNHRSSTPTTSPSSPSTSPPSSPGNPSPSYTRVVTFHPINDFGVVTTGRCFWSIQYNEPNYDLEIGVEFTISYTGLLVGATTTFDMTPAIGGYHTVDDHAQATTHIYHVGAGDYTTSPYLGQNVKVTGTITTPDTSSADDVATMTVAMPTLQTIQNVGTTTGVDHQVSCG